MSSTPIKAPSEAVQHQVVVDAMANRVLDSLRFRIQRLIAQELSGTPVQGVDGADRRAIDPKQPELFDDDTGSMIFG